MPNKNNRMKNRVVYYNHEHDDRLSLGTDSRRRVSFKNFGGNRYKNNRRRARDEKMKAEFDTSETDMEMIISRRLVSNYQRGRYPYIGHQGGSKSRRRDVYVRRDSPNPGKKLPESPVHWYKVVIPEGYRYEREYILSLLMSYIKPSTFVPLGYKKEGDAVVFFVDDYKAAQQLMQADRKITTNDDWRIPIIVRANIPQVTVDDGLKALMKLAMAGRYNAVNKALDLSNFHLDPEILKENTFCPLNRVNVMIAAIQIISDSIPGLLALNLSDNKLVTIDGLKTLKTKTANLKILHIGKNKIRFIDQFDPLQGLQIEELELDGNALCDKFRDKETYIREVQKRFPKVVKLDGTEVPPCITFDVEAEIALVPSQGSFLCNPAAADVIRPFLLQYYTLYDSDSRAPLIDAYHDDAQFSLACSPHSNNSASLAPYFESSRNLLVVSHPERRSRLLRRGKSTILTYLTSLPRTQHDPATLIVDCSIFTPSIIMLSVTGVFREVGGDKKYPMRSFQRSFIIVPCGGGFCIINDLLHISPATSDQVKGAFKAPEAEANPAVASQAAPAPPVVPVTPAVPDIPTQQQMVTTLAMQTGMNLTFSEKCLSENGWDFNRSLYIFSELHKQGKIPPDAFVK